MSDAPLLEVRDLAVRFPARRRGLLGRPTAWLRAVDGVSFELRRGEALGLVGESGCGKSTVARTIVGLHRATAGSVRLDGVELTRLTAREWSLGDGPMITRRHIARSFLARSRGTLARSFAKAELAALLQGRSPAAWDNRAASHSATISARDK